MRYRPEGWDNPYKVNPVEEIPTAIGGGAARFATKLGHWAYEAGADAMHKAVVEWLEKALEPEHWYGAGWDGIIEHGVTHYFIDAGKWEGFKAEEQP